MPEGIDDGVRVDRSQHNTLMRIIDTNSGSVQTSRCSN